MNRIAFVLFTIFEVSVIKTEDVCYAPFSQFLKCLSTEANNRVQMFEEDATPAVQLKIKHCFSNSNDGCKEPDFDKVSVESFLSEPWSSRVKTILDLLESTDPRVQQCMINYFSGIGQRKVQDCVRAYGDADVKNFEMPPLPEIRGVDITKLKMAVLNRMVVTQSLSDCSNILTNDDQLQEKIDCIKAARIASGSPMCSARETCKKNNINDASCLNRYDKVQDAACRCFAAEKEKLTSGNSNLDNWAELKQSLFQGGMEKEYKRCHDINNLPYPKDRVDKAKKAIKDSVKDVFMNGGLPPEVKKMMRTIAQSMREITGQVQKVFCSSCADEKVLSTGNQEAQQIRRFTQKQQQQQSQPANSGGTLLERLRNLFGNQG